MDEEKVSKKRSKPFVPKKGNKPAQRFLKPNADGGGGVSKIKASLRQTRRLLAKDNLSASVKQEAERKLKALEGDLQMKEGQQRERKNAQRYHKVRFLERQKLVRRISKLKRSLEKSSESKLEEELFEARMLLNYVLFYPMTQKYVALFPNQGGDDQADRGTLKESSASASRSAKVKEQIVAAMKRGEMSNEPEVELELRTKEDEKSHLTDRKRLLEQSELSTEKARGGKSTKADSHIRNNLEDDDFFAASDEK